MKERLAKEVEASNIARYTLLMKHEKYPTNIQPRPYDDPKHRYTPK